MLRAVELDGKPAEFHDRGLTHDALDLSNQSGTGLASSMFNGAGAHCDEFTPVISVLGLQLQKRLAQPCRST